MNQIILQLGAYFVKYGTSTSLCYNSEVTEWSNWRCNTKNHNNVQVITTLGLVLVTEQDYFPEERDK